MLRVIRLLLLSLVSIAVGALFLYSAYTKIYSLESFERFQYTIVEYVHLPWWMAIHTSRLLIGMEGALGVLIAGHLFGNRKWVLSIAMWLLLAFSVYLIYLWSAVGNDINCGCFGDKIWMSPASSLVKNIVLIAIIWLIRRFHNGFNFKKAQLITLITFGALTLVPYILFPLPPSQPNWLKKDKYQLNLSALYEEGKADAPTIDLTKGKHVIVFASLTCPHCKMAAYKMHVMKQKNPDLPFYIVYAGSKKYLAEFWKETQAEGIPHTKLEAEKFTELAGFSWPAIFLVNDGWVEGQTTYISMNQAEIEDWIGKTSSK